MRRVFIAGLGVLLLALLLSRERPASLDHPTPTSGTTATGSGAPPAVDGDHVAVERETVAPSPAPTDEPAPAASGLHGRVFDRNGEPVADAEVALHGRASYVEPVGGPSHHVRVEDLPVRLAHTDERGRFHFDDVAPNAGYWLIARRDPLDIGSCTDLVVPESGRLDAGPIVLREGGRLAGRVRDPTGLGVPDVTIEAGVVGGTARSDAGGSFSLPLPEGSWKLRVHREGHAYSGRTEWSVRPGEIVTDIELVMSPALEIRGRVVSHAGLPVAGARVGVEGDPASRSAPTGSFVVGGLASGAHRLWAEAPGYCPTGLTGPFEAGTDDVRITMVPAHRLRGRAVAAGSGRPISLTALSWVDVYPHRELWDQGSKYWRKAEWVAGDDGRFELFVHGSSHVALRAEAAGFPPVVSEVVEVLAEATVTEVPPLRFGAAAPVEVEVVDSDGRPVAGAVVRASSMIEPWRGVRFEEPTTDARGRATVEGLPPGFFRLSAEHPEWFTSEEVEHVTAAGRLADWLSERGVADLASRAGPRRIVMVAAGAVEGTLRDPAGRPLAARLLRLPDGFHPGGARAMTDAAGAFRFERVPPGKYLIHLVGDPGTRLSPSLSWIDVEPGATRTLDLIGEPKPRASVIGVVLENGVPRPNVRVLVRASRPRSSRPSTHVTDAGGRFRATRVSPGRHDVWVTDGIDRVAGRRGFELVAGETAEVEIRIETGDLELRFVDGVSGRPVRVEELSLRVEEGGSVEEYRDLVEPASGVHGSLHLEGVTAGSYELVVRAPGYHRPTPTTVRVPSGGRAVQEVALSRGGWARLFLSERPLELAVVDYVSIGVYDDAGRRIADDHRWERTDVDPIWFPLDESVESAEIRVTMMGERTSRRYRGTGPLTRADDGVRESTIVLERW